MYRSRLISIINPMTFSLFFQKGLGINVPANGLFNAQVKPLALNAFSSFYFGCLVNGYWNYQENS
jgi:hypothetical protein